MKRLARAAPLLVALPGVLLSLGVAGYMLNHFFFGAPYLFDSGLLSGIAYRSGLLQQTATVTADVPSFYQIYFSPLISVFSGLSYLVPVERIEWFAIVEGIVFFPTGIAVAMLSSRLDPTSLVRRLPITMLAAFAFSFSGMVLWMVGFPHYEAAIPGFVCLLLVSIVTGRRRMTWVFLVLAASVRQDGGFLAALAISPLVYLRWRGTEMVASLRTLVILFAAAVGASVFGIVAQKVFFVPLDRLRAVYFGTPAYAHLTMDEVVARSHAFLEQCQVIYYPLLATALVSALRRDARYLFGWAAMTPWFILNFTAVDVQKSTFIAYTIAPFVVSMFWVYVYGALLAPPARRLRPGAIEAVFALVCISSTLGSHRSHPVELRVTLTEMAIPHPRNRAAVHAFVDALKTHRAKLGRFYVDYAVASIAIEAVEAEHRWSPGITPAPDAFAFHDHALGEGMDVLLSELMTNQLDVCTVIVGTHLLLCSRERPPADIFADVPHETMPMVFALTRARRTNVRLDEHGMVFHSGSFVNGALGRIARGTYEWTVSFSTPPGPNAEPEARLFVETDRDMLADVTAPAGAHEIRVTFVADGGELPLAYRFTSSSIAPLTITSARLRRVDVPAPAPAGR